MTTLVQDLFGFERKEALNLCSQTACGVTQVVNGVVGVHAALPHGAIRPRVAVDPAAWWSRVPAATGRRDARSSAPTGPTGPRPGA
ncbi:hypothetical protein ACQP2P_36010 [Dactylosporangium sp. CA-139114]|uniref:hypothetical protein n=1 Tax=Dactylosporangium sp. CA-139114 TaxID=3239931 RepID=UPI003D95EFF8